MLLDLHSHILPGVDDGAKDIGESLKLLEMMKEQGITHVIATPHFYPSMDAIDSFEARVATADVQLRDAVKEKDLPHILLGSEVLYYRHIGRSESIRRFCLAGSPYLLLELSNNSINNGLFDDLEALIQEVGVKPILAHIERYHRYAGYQKLLNYVRENHVPAQINASAVSDYFEFRVVKRLIRQDIVSFVATDAHSSDQRPPMMKQAFEKIGRKFGMETVERFAQNSRELYQKITQDGNDEK